MTKNKQKEEEKKRLMRQTRWCLVYVSTQ